MPWAASSLTLTHVAAGKPTVGGAGRAPWAARMPRPISSSSAVETPGSDGVEHRVAGLGDGPAGDAQPGEVVVVVDGHRAQSDRSSG